MKLVETCMNELIYVCKCGYSRGVRKQARKLKEE